jgi:putative glutamine amidotransferase
LEKHAAFAVKDKNVLNPVTSDAIGRAGGIPLIIPISEYRSRLEDVFGALDGILLPGGEDIPPSVYGQAPHPTVNLMPEAQYALWQAMLNLALDHGKPLFAFCAGIQVVNVALGGTLIQDIPSQVDSNVCHRNPNRPPDALHPIDVEPASRLADILGRTHLAVNSSHHQAIDRLGQRMVVTARCADDGIIEAAEIQDHPFLLAVQWHPERYFDGDSSARLFGAFIEACRTHARQ